MQQAALSEARSSEWMPAALRTMSTQARPQSLHTAPKMSLLMIVHLLLNPSSSTKTSHGRDGQGSKVGD